MKFAKWPSFLVILVAFIACSKENTNDTSNLYEPTNSDVTVNATLAELQQGRTLFINNCGACHSLYSPDSYSVTQWKSIISQMAPRTSMTSSQVTLVTKYVCKGKQ
jgi:cytochrome c2